MTPDEFVSALAPAAVSSMVATGIPAAFTVAQGALESTWGRSDLAVRAKNLFSVKDSFGWRGPVLVMNSREFVNGKSVMLPARWRVYASWDECLADRAAFFKNNPRYQHCFAEKTTDGWARAVQAAGYATDPDYASKVMEVATSHNLLRLDLP